MYFGILKLKIIPGILTTKKAPDLYENGGMQIILHTLRSRKLQSMIETTTIIIKFRNYSYLALQIGNYF